MTIYYSFTSGGFYDDRIFSVESLPKDVVEVSEEEHLSLLQNQYTGGSIGVDANGKPIAVPPPALSLAEVQVLMCASVDATADAVYNAIGGPTPGRLAEYQQASNDASAFKAAGYSGTAPVTVSCWSQANAGWTDQQAADDIIATASKWMIALQNIRSARLLGKSAVNAASDIASAEAAAQAAIANVQQAATGV